MASSIVACIETSSGFAAIFTTSHVFGGRNFRYMGPSIIE
jgi:hypothetical protein